MAFLRGHLLAPLAATALIATAVVHGSSNTVAITHRSSLASPAYSQHGLSVNIIKERPADEEYVTDFYSRVRDKRRAMFGRQLREHDVAERRGQEDHSLDHYFDHGLASAHHHHQPPKNCNEKKEIVEGGTSSSCAVRSVRGGGSAEGLMARPARRPFHYSTASRGGHEDHGRHGEEYCDTASARLGDDSSHHKRRGRRGHHGHSKRVDSHHHHKKSHHVQDHGLFDDDDDFFGDCNAPYDEYDLQEEGQGGDDYPEHHLGLLRVPCSIAINSGEASHHYPHHASHHRDGSSQGKTSMAAYVDTGAQVTVISAAAAKRAGIYHLMDRRYAGRATGVGHCKVLGRIPARHVYFILGEGCNDNDYEDDFRDEMDYRGGGEPFPEEANTAQMDGPALTVLEGTVTQGVDVLLGMDVLQDWEAEIRMGSKKSLTVKKRRNKNGGGGSVVIPFASSPARRHAEERRPARPTRPAFVERRSHHRHHPSHVKSGSPSNHRSKPHSHSVFDDEEDDEDFSPTASDIESDLDLLDQSGREFPEESYVDTRSIQEMENELLGIDMAVDDEEDGEWDEDDDDLDLEEEDDDEGECDMAGL